jgi:alpha 1,3-glucosidase
LFVQGGTILPLLIHDNCLSILSCINNPISLEIYLDENGEAIGEMYVDDGETFNYQQEDQSALIRFTFASNTLSSAFISG